MIYETASIGISLPFFCECLRTISAKKTKQKKGGAMWPSAYSEGVGTPD
jgi:hypothetical protein